MQKGDISESLIYQQLPSMAQLMPEAACYLLLQALVLARLISV